MKTKTIKIDVQVEIGPGYSDTDLVCGIMETLINAGYDVLMGSIPGLKLSPTKEGK